MLTRLVARNFKRFDCVDVELGDPVVFIGPNNSGKTSALQALALWEIGLKRWTERRKRTGRETPEKRPGVTINRRDLISVPVPDANLLWRNLHVRNVSRADGRQTTRNIRIDLLVSGIHAEAEWTCGLEFDYANDESFYCRPLRLDGGKTPERMAVPEAASVINVAFLPPMSGLVANESRLDPGAIKVRVGEGRTAEVLRNLCHTIHERDRTSWTKIATTIRDLFRVDLAPPTYIPERGEIAMSYAERGTTLDLSSSGRGLQQILLLLSYMYANPRSVLLLDEPDAHLEILRQREVYRVLTDAARDSGSQIVAASHSEVLLNEAAERDVVVAFVGARPHRIDDRGSQLRKSLQDIGFDDYYLTEASGWILYLEGSTDLAILREFSEKLHHHSAIRALARPFVKYVTNQPSRASDHFYGICEAYPDTRGFALFDRLPRPDGENTGRLILRFWSKYEIENYLCHRETLEAYAAQSIEGDISVPGPLFSQAETERRVAAMRESIEDVEDALATLDRKSPWEGDLRVSDEFLKPVFQKYFSRLGMPNIMLKTRYHVLVRYVPVELIDDEVSQILDGIASVFESVRNASIESWTDRNQTEQFDDSDQL